jgi:DNA-binding IclR family transcriptional regulator
MIYGINANLILAHLANGPRTTKELAKLLQLHPVTVQRNLQVIAHRVRRVGWGTWELKKL